MPAKKRTTPKAAPASAKPPTATPAPAAKSKRPLKSAKEKEVVASPVAEQATDNGTPAVARKRPATKSVKKSVEAVEAVEAREARGVVSTTPPDAPARPLVSTDAIREAAFFLSLRRRGPADPVADWLEAERLLLAKAG